MNVEALVEDQDVKWGHEMGAVLPRDGGDVEGFEKMEISDRQRIQDVSIDIILISFDLMFAQELGLVQLEAEDRCELVLLDTGEHGVRRTHSVILGARCVELAEGRFQGRTGSQQAYNQLARELPQVCWSLVGPGLYLTSSSQALPIYIAKEDAEPAGWDEDKFGGAFPLGGIATVKALVPPTHKSWRDKKNFHTTTVVFAQQDNPANHLRLGPKLRRVVSHHCTCRSGSRTNAACCHVSALITMLAGPSLYRSPKVEEPRIADPERSVRIACDQYLD